MQESDINLNGGKKEKGKRKKEKGKRFIIGYGLSFLFAVNMRKQSIPSHKDYMTSSFIRYSDINLNDEDERERSTNNKHPLSLVVHPASCIQHHSFN